MGRPAAGGECRREGAAGAGRQARPGRQRPAPDHRSGSAAHRRAGPRHRREGGDRGDGSTHRRHPRPGEPAQLRSEHLLGGSHHRSMERPEPSGGPDAQPCLPGISASQHLQGGDHDRRPGIRSVRPQLDPADRGSVLLRRSVLRRSRRLRVHRLPEGTGGQQQQLLLPAGAQGGP